MVLKLPNSLTCPSSVHLYHHPSFLLRLDHCLLSLNRCPSFPHPVCLLACAMDTLVAQYTRSPFAREGCTPEEHDYYHNSLPSISLNFALPPVSRPAAFLRATTDDYSNPNCPIKLAHGTTTLAFRFKGGIIVATDSRATAGSWIASQTVKKVIEINPMLLGTMAGGAAVCPKKPHFPP